MSHNYKAPQSIDPQERRDEKQIRCMASVLQQHSLDVLLEGARPDMRAAMLERLLPHLKFVPAELLVIDIEPPASADCPHCGLRRGTVTAHDCAN